MTEDAPPIKITKLEGAKRQLRIAIRLWFDDADPIAIYTLAAATYDIIHTLHRRKGLTGLLFDSKLVKDEDRQQWVREIKAIANFFKHADRDPNSVFEFNPFANDMLLFFSAKALEEMGEPLGIEEGAFLQWAFVSHTDLFPESIYEGAPIDALENFRIRGKREFFKGYLFWRQAANNPGL
jgi:hypothetical protein